MGNTKTLFAFKLADRSTNESAVKAQKWSARAGVSIAGCTDEAGGGNFRYDQVWPWYARDQGDWC